MIPLFRRIGWLVAFVALGASAPATPSFRVQDSQQPNNQSPNTPGNPRAVRTIRTLRAGQTIPTPRVVRTIRTPRAGQTIPTPRAGQTILTLRAAQTIPTPRVGQTIPTLRAGRRSKDFLVLLAERRARVGSFRDDAVLQAIPALYGQAAVDRAS